MACAGTRAAAAAALLFSAAVVLLLLLQVQAQAPAPGLAAADLLASALDLFLDGRSLLELATRRNMILLCHAILVLILRDAGVLGPPASRRSRSSPPAPAPAPAIAAAAPVVAPTACLSPVAPVRTHATRGAAVVWRRRPRSRPAKHERQTPRGAAAEEAAATWAAPALAARPPQAAEEAAAVATKEIVLVESRRNADDDLPHHHDRAVVVERLDHPTAIAADGERDDCDDRRRIAADDDTAREQQDSGMGMGMELADDRTFEEFIESQRRQMRQESLQLQLQPVSSGYHYQAITACY